MAESPTEAGQVESTGPGDTGGHEGESNGESSGGHGHGLTIQIIIAILAAILIAVIVPVVFSKETALTIFAGVGIGGEVFLRALTMMVVPLVIASVMTGILGMGDVRKLGFPGLAAILYYVSTTILAVVVGLVIVSVIRPGVGVKPKDVAGKSALVDSGDRRQLRKSIVDISGLDTEKVVGIFPQLAPDSHDDKESADHEAHSTGTLFANLVLMLFTDNLFKSAVETQLLPLIVFSIIFAAMLTTLGKRVDDITEIISELNTAMMSFVMLLMKLAPIGIFCLIAARFGKAVAEGELLEMLSRTGWFVLTVLLGLGIHMFGTLPLLYWIFKRKNPYTFMRQMAQALLTAFSTASSSATLPVTMQCAVERGGVSKRSTDFVIPLGATINMDGTALYEAAAAIFIAQIYAATPAAAAAGFELDFVTMLTIAVTATLAAIGAAGIPEAGLVTMMIVLNAVGLPIEYVTMIISVDWLLDRFRTATNTFGDAVGAAIVDETFDDS